MGIYHHHHHHHHHHIIILCHLPNSQCSETYLEPHVSGISFDLLTTTTLTTSSLKTPRTSLLPVGKSTSNHGVQAKSRQSGPNDDQEGRVVKLTYTSQGTSTRILTVWSVIVTHITSHNSQMEAEARATHDRTLSTINNLTSAIARCRPVAIVLVLPCY